MIKEFLKPDTLEQALQFFEDHQGLAGFFGNGVFINNHKYNLNYETVISLKNLGLDRLVRGPVKKSRGVTIGALVTFQNLIDHDNTPRILKQAALHEPSRLIRNMKTIGGDISAGPVLSGLSPCLVALSARVQKKDLESILLEDYLNSNRKGLVLNIFIPDKDVKCKIKKVCLQSNSPAIVTAAVSMHYDQKKKIEKIIIAVREIGKKVIRLGKIEKQLENGSINAVDNVSIEKAVFKQVNPVSDINGTSEYKKYIAGVAVADCINQCLA
ncbi:MAG: hypothetical protein GXP56_17640 [Deltaproteobacteria bacterium]|nr:hypothetical protein [Deltaproteobacteria bacterium]